MRADVVNLYCIYDVDGEFASPPQPFRNDFAALRQMEVMRRKKALPPGTYQCVFVGTFDSRRCVMSVAKHRIVGEDALTYEEYFAEEASDEIVS